MKRNILLSLISLFVLQTLIAAPITYRQARNTALKFLSRNTQLKFGTSSDITFALPDNDIQPYYVFNVADDGGFVIVSGDDAVCPILGYAYSGHFDALNAPDNMKNWLEGYAHDIEYIQSLNIPARKYKEYKNETRENIPALVTAEWDQKTPFNNQCPYSKSGKYHRPTGCVATAIAQVMYYHKWPQDKTSAIKGYSYKDDELYGGDGSEINIEPLEPTVFDWDSMLDRYDEGKYDEKSADAVAELMKYVGHSVEMMYGVKASAAFSEDIAGALVHCFGYKKTVQHIYRADYATQEKWDDVIYRELSEKRPVIYSGVTKFGSGHQFVCDGYEDNYFHINWGWSGESNGFFKLSALDPYNQGIGGAGTGSSFSELQTAVIGVDKPIEHDVVFAGDITAEAGRELSLDIQLDNITTDYTSVQFDMQLPEGFDIKESDDGYPIAVMNQLRSEAGDHVVSMNKMEDRKYRFVIYSPSNSLITEKEGALMSTVLNIEEGVVNGNYTAEISNVITCNKKLFTKEIRGSKFVIDIVPTGIDYVTADDNENIIYTIGGMHIKGDVKTLERGIYIVKGRKIMVN